MKTIRENVTNEIIIKNSKFITLLIKIENQDDIPLLLAEAKKNYPKATHYCYAYIIKDYKKASDDGEPGGTAGTPMLNVLEKEDLFNILAITIRYFGGIKLGAGGLVRAYKKSITDALVKAWIKELVLGYFLSLTITYDKQKEVDYLLKNYQILDKNYEEKITYFLNIPKENINILQSYNYEIIKEDYIEKVHK